MQSEQLKNDFVNLEKKNKEEIESSGDETGDILRKAISVSGIKMGKPDSLSSESEDLNSECVDSTVENEKIAEAAENPQEPVPATDAKTTPVHAATRKTSVKNRVVDRIDALPPPKEKQFIYKLKNKSGRVLSYRSNVPVTLKRPYIRLVKLDDSAIQAICTAYKEKGNSCANGTEDHADSSPSAGVRKERKSLKRNREVSKIKRGSTSETVRNENSSDKVNESQQGGGIQTRKKVLRFLPDGRLLQPNDDSEIGSSSFSSSSSSSCFSPSGSSSDSDEDDLPKVKKQKKETDEEYQNPEKKKYTPLPKKTNTRVTGGVPKRGQNVNSTPLMQRIEPELLTGILTHLPKKMSTRVLSTVPNNTQNVNSTPLVNETKRKVLTNGSCQVVATSGVSHVEIKTPDGLNDVITKAAQVLSAILGITVLTNQLTITKYKPKIIANMQTTSAPVFKKLSLNELKNAVTGVNFRPISNNSPSYDTATEAHLVSKPVATNTPTRTYNRLRSSPMAHHILVPEQKLPVGEEILSGILKRFENFTDSRVVKTKLGPKKKAKQDSKLEGTIGTLEADKTKQAVQDCKQQDAIKALENEKTLYELFYDVFEKMPTWNIHIIPDNNSLCIAQISRGRSGMPVLKKSIELSSNYFGKIYINQLHCKRYDGVYDTEAKLLKLIKEIDSIAM